MHVAYFLWQNSITKNGTWGQKGKTNIKWSRDEKNIKKTNNNSYSCLISFPYGMIGSIHSPKFWWADGKFAFHTQVWG